MEVNLWYKENKKYSSMRKTVLILVRANTVHFVSHWKGWALKIETFWARKWQRPKQVPFGPKKVDFEFCTILLLVMLK